MKTPEYLIKDEIIMCNQRYHADLNDLFTPKFEYLKYRLHDGRISGHLVEDIIPNIFPKNILAYKPCKYRDWLYKDLVAIECKCLTVKGLANIATSVMVGSGRKFDQEKFDEICSIRAYCVVDIRPENFIFPFTFIKGYRGMDHIISSNDFDEITKQSPRSIDELFNLE